MSGGQVDIRLKYVIEDTDRHGNVRIYYRHGGPKIRLRGPTGSVEFLTDYRAASRPVKECKPQIERIGILTKGSQMALRPILHQRHVSGT